MAFGAGWSAGGAALTRALTMCTWIIAARALGREAFGALGIIQTTLAMFSVMAGFGLGITATKYVAEYRETRPERAGRIIGLAGLLSAALGVVGGLTLFSLAPLLAREVLGLPELTALLRVSGLIVSLNAVEGAMIGALTGFEAFRAIAAIQAASGAATFICVLVGIRVAGLLGVIWGLAASHMLTGSLACLLVWMKAEDSGVPLSVSGIVSEFPLLWRFSLPALLGSVMVIPVNWICSAFLVSQPYGLGQMGLYSAALQWRTAIVFIPTKLSAVALPLLSAFRGTSDSRRYTKVLNYSLLVNGGLVAAAAMGTGLFSGQIMSLYGSDFTARAPLLLLSCSAVFVVVNHILGAVVASEERMWLGLVANAAWAVVMVAGTLLWAPQAGASGMALAALVSVPVQTVVLAFPSWRRGVVSFRAIRRTAAALARSF